MLMSDAAPSASALATMNGVYQISIVLPQAVAPATATSLFALSIKHRYILNGNIVWVVFFGLGE